MSRTGPAIVAIALFSGAPALAQDSSANDRATARTAEQALAESVLAYGPAPPEPDCGEAENPDEIVVCAEIQEQEQFCVRSDEKALDDYARETMNKGDPKAPDVSGPGIFKGKATIGGLCLIPPCPPPPALIIDFSELPETPPGSDADRVGRGLAPRGEDGVAPEDRESPPTEAPPVSPSGSVSPATEPQD